jgi:hypothetical protein
VVSAVDSTAIVAYEGKRLLGPTVFTLQVKNSTLRISRSSLKLILTLLSSSLSEAEPVSEGFSLVPKGVLEENIRGNRGANPERPTG